jgi:hypothetical protein
MTRRATSAWPYEEVPVPRAAAAVYRALILIAERRLREMEPGSGGGGGGGDGER